MKNYLIKMVVDPNPLFGTKKAQEMIINPVI